MPHAGHFIIPGGDEGIISLALHHLAKFARTRKPAYARPPFCGGSNPWAPGSNPHYQTQ